MNKDVISSTRPVNRTDEDPFTLQKSHLEYRQPDYLKPNRMSSYGHQYRLALEANMESYLNVGSASSLLAFLLSKQGKFIVDLDIDVETQPVLSARIPDLPFRSKSFDVVMCFQVLEHLPFTLFSICLLELSRVARRQVILSLPDMTQSSVEKMKYNVYKFLKHPREWKNYKPRSIDPEHFWEIGCEDIGTSDIISCFQKLNLTVLEDFRNELNPYHHFFVLETREQCEY